MTIYSPQITVLTPVLNASKYIVRCIESVREQTGINVQHIFIDGGSTDDTIEIIRSYGMDVLEKKGSSIYEALNFGIIHAKAPLVGCLNADDIYSSETVLESVYRAFSRGGCRIIYGNCDFVDEYGCLIYRLARRVRTDSWLARLRIFNVSHPSWFIPLEALNLLGGFDSSLRYIADCDLLLRAGSSGVAIEYIDQSIAKFMLRAESASRTAAAQAEIEYYLKRTLKLQFGLMLHKVALISLYGFNMRYYLFRALRNQSNNATSGN